VRKNLPRDVVVASEFLAVAKFVTAQKPLIHRHFRVAPFFAQENARAEIFLPRHGADDVVARRLRTLNRAVTHKI